MVCVVRGRMAAIFAFTDAGFRPGVALGGVGAGTGSASLPAIIPPGLSGVSLTTQAFIVDAANPIGASSTNGVAFTIN